TRPDTLSAAVAGADHLILTVGVTKRPAPERLVKSVEYDGTLYILEAAQSAGLRGRFMYMSAIGTTKGSILSFGLNLIKGNTLRWRRRAEDEIRRSGLDFTIVHSGILSSAPAGQRAIRISRDPLPMSLAYRISRGDVAEVFVQALRHSATRRTTFDAVWTRGKPGTDWDPLFARLEPGT
ncbi:MAG: NAD(P)H-binding protein, partial [Gemmatimonadota bacterium]|nr:NAD(P)H-binding protein [Gemmatimonadota bacterium]